MIYLRVVHAIYILKQKGKTLVVEICVIGCVVDQKTYFLDSFSFEHQQFSNPKGTYE